MEKSGNDLQSSHIFTHPGVTRAQHVWDTIRSKYFALKSMKISKFLKIDHLHFVTKNKIVVIMNS